jgi:metal-responsive CopG/Arc/MetJ family transcriptional regulator
VKKLIDKDYTKLRSEFIRILNRMVTLYRETNLPVACGVLVVLCDIEASSLNDEEARLVHCITGIHIDRAASIIKTKSTTGTAAAALRPA